MQNKENKKECCELRNPYIFYDTRLNTCKRQEICPCHNPQDLKEGWEKEFDENFNGVYYGKNDDGTLDFLLEEFKNDVKNFIKTELQKARQETLREVSEKLKGKNFYYLSADGKKTINCEEVEKLLEDMKNN